MPRHRSNDDAHFAAPPSFMGVPFSRDLAGSKAAILGVPFDCGTHAVRIGSRLGPHAIRLPQLRALHRKYPDLALLHIDAHTDTYPTEGYNTATTFTRAAEEGLLDTAHSLHIGARGPVYMPEVFEHTRQHGYRLVTGVDLFARGIPSVLEEVHATLGGRPVYLCFDMDFFDPSCAPGVCTPAWGGASAP